jgi:hypothetical protein
VPSRSDSSGCKNPTGGKILECMQLLARDLESKAKLWLEAYRSTTAMSRRIMLLIGVEYPKLAPRLFHSEHALLRWVRLGM